MVRKGYTPEQIIKMMWSRKQGYSKGTTGLLVKFGSSWASSNPIARVYGESLDSLPWLR